MIHLLSNPKVKYKPWMEEILLHKGLGLNPRNPFVAWGYCGCGCGSPTEICTHTHKKDRVISGEPNPFYRHHFYIESIGARFWTKVNVCGVNECWEWKSFKDRDGYGRFKFDGEITAHRVSWKLYRGDIPDDMCVCHSCDNPSCVNPNHLFLGTTLDNIQDMVRKGRSPRMRGIRNGMSKLQPNDVHEIRRLRALKVPQKLVARMFKVSKGHVSEITRHIKWGHLV